MSKQDNATKYLKKRKHPFVQIPSAIFEVTKNKSTICLYLSLMTYADSEGFCFPSYNKIKDQTGMSNTTIAKALEELKSIGLLSVEKQRRHGNVQENNTYYIEFDIGKPSSPKNGVGEISSPKNELGSSPKNGVGLVQKMECNYNQDNYNHFELDNKGAKAPLSKIETLPSLPQKKKSKLEIQEEKLNNLKIQLASLEEYPKQDRLDFYNKWTEVNTLTNSKQMRFEKEKYFHVKKRMATWMKNKAKWSNPQEQKQERDEFRENSTAGMTIQEKVIWEHKNGYISDAKMRELGML